MVVNGFPLQDRNTEAKYFEEDHLAVQFKLDNELDLVYAAIFQKVIKLNYLDGLREGRQEAARLGSGRQLQGCRHARSLQGYARGCAVPEHQ